jgi:hypothetical protein
MELGIFGFLTLMYLGFAVPPFSEPHIETFSEKSCSAAPFVSAQTHKKVMMKFHNNSDKTWKIDWVDFEGNIKNYWVIKRHETASQPTYIGHIWQISDRQGVCKKRVVAKRGVNKVSVE